MRPPGALPRLACAFAPFGFGGAPALLPAPNRPLRIGPARRREDASHTLGRSARGAGGPRVAAACVLRARVRRAYILSLFCRFSEPQPYLDRISVVLHRQAAMPNRGAASAKPGPSAAGAPEFQARLEDYKKATKREEKVRSVWLQLHRGNGPRKAKLRCSRAAPRVLTGDGRAPVSCRVCKGEACTLRPAGLRHGEGNIRHDNHPAPPLPRAYLWQE